MRIVSFVPAATQALAVLGLRQSLVGVSHACCELVDLSGVDAAVLTRPLVSAASSGPATDAAVRAAVENREELHAVEETRSAQPDWWMPVAPK